MDELATEISLHANGIRFNAAVAGPEDGPLVVLLHGFPEFWKAWKLQIPALVAAGFRVLAPDLRGYNLSEKPRGVKSYDIQILVDDVRELVRAIKREKAIIVGHDWGGAIAWATAISAPEVVEKLIVINGPHPAAFFRELRTIEQALRSWYIFFFQLPIVPELWAKHRDYQIIDLAFSQCRPGTFTDDEKREFRTALSQPGALTAAINYYRAAIRRDPRRTLSDLKPKITAPTLLIWGDRDVALGKRLTRGLDRWVQNLRIEHIADAGHWVQKERADQVNRWMLDFIA